MGDRAPILVKPVLLCLLFSSFNVSNERVVVQGEVIHFINFNSFLNGPLLEYWNASWNECRLDYLITLQKVNDGVAKCDVRMICDSFVRHSNSHGVDRIEVVKVVAAYRFALGEKVQVGDERLWVGQHQLAPSQSLEQMFYRIAKIRSCTKGCSNLLEILTPSSYDRSPSQNVLWKM